MRVRAGWDVLQAGVDDMDVIFVGCLPIEVDPEKQEVGLQTRYPE
jgi:hypothetical protein